MVDQTIKAWCEHFHHDDHLSNDEKHGGAYTVEKTNDRTSLGDAHHVFHC